MRGDQVGRKCSIVRAFEIIPDGSKITGIPEREGTGIITVCRALNDLAESLLYTDRAETPNRWACIDTFSSKFPPLAEFMPFYFYKEPVHKPLDQCPPLIQFPTGHSGVDFIRRSGLFNFILIFAGHDREACWSSLKTLLRNEKAGR